MCKFGFSMECYFLIMGYCWLLSPPPKSGEEKKRKEGTHIESKKHPIIQCSWLFIAVRQSQWWDLGSSCLLVPSSRWDWLLRKSKRLFVMR